MNAFFAPKIVAFVSLMLAFVACMILALPDPRSLFGVLDLLGTLTWCAAVVSAVVSAFVWATARGHQGDLHFGKWALAISIGCAYLGFAVITPNVFTGPGGLFCLAVGAFMVALVMMILIPQDGMPTSANKRFMVSMTVTVLANIALWKAGFGPLWESNPVFGGTTVLVGSGAVLGLLYLMDRSPVDVTVRDLGPAPVPADTDRLQVRDCEVVGRNLDIKV